MLRSITQPIKISKSRNRASNVSIKSSTHEATTVLVKDVDGFEGIVRRSSDSLPVPLEEEDMEDEGGNVAGDNSTENDVQDGEGMNNGSKRE